MSDYNTFVTSINKIFDYLSKMKIGWNSLDNNNYIESIEEYKQAISNCAEEIKQGKMKDNIESLEALGDD